MGAFSRLFAWLKVAAREHWLPLLILAVPINVVVWRSDTAGPLLVLSVPLGAAVVGLVLRPRHVWLVWLGSVVIEWIALAVWGKYSHAGPDETPLSLTLEAFAWMALGVLLPVWIGRFVGRGIRAGRHPVEPPRGIPS